MDKPASYIEVDGFRYVPDDQNRPPAEHRIVVAQRGWVFYGTYNATADEIVLTDASVIRVWGTTKGLGQLAESGPTSNTKLDPIGTVRLHPLGVVATIDVHKAW